MFGVTGFAHHPTARGHRVIAQMIGLDVLPIQVRQTQPGLVQPGVVPRPWKLIDGETPRRLRRTPRGAGTRSRAQSPDRS
jgi:hypothetical protein